MNACPLLAAGFDWLEALLPFLFVAFWIISQVFAVFRRLQGGGQRPQPPVRIDRPRGQPRPAGRAGDDVRSELERQIEEFLRQATGDAGRRPEEPAQRGRPAAAGQPRPAPARPIEQPRADRPATQRAQPAPTPKRPPRDKQPDATREERRPPAASAAPAPPASAAQGESVARHVQDAFAHELGHLRGGLAHDEARRESAAPPRPEGVAAELLEMLRSPAATRRAILLREVLDRPVDRW